MYGKEEDIDIKICHEIHHKIVKHKRNGEDKRRYADIILFIS